MADTAFLVVCCEKQRHVNCNVLSPFFFDPRVMIIFVSQCAIMIMLRLLMNIIQYYVYNIIYIYIITLCII